MKFFLLNIYVNIIK